MGTYPQTQQVPYDSLAHVVFLCNVFNDSLVSMPARLWRNARGPPPRDNANGNQCGVPWLVATFDARARRLIFASGDASIRFGDVELSWYLGSEFGWLSRAAFVRQTASGGSNCGPTTDVHQCLRLPMLG